MKRLLPLCALILGLPALAEHSVSLQPGASVYIDGTTVYCAGSTNHDLPRCTTAQSIGNTYRVYVGGQVWGNVEGFEAAIAAVTKLKQSGLCQ